MRLFRHYTNLPADARGAVVALGNFDGVHRGHAAVIGRAGEIARTSGGPLAVMTFEPHPRSLFRPADPPFRLTPFRPKAHAIEKLGADLLFVVPFDRAFSEKDAPTFVEDVLVSGLGARHVVAGEDFVFGHRRGGTMAMLAADGRFGVTRMSPILAPDGGICSSTRVRQALAAGDTGLARMILGRSWEIDGRVVHGDQRGRTLGYPTANVPLGEYLRPAYGIYAIRAAVDTHDPVWHDGVASLGIRPMWKTDEPMLEAHLFDFAGDLYGQNLRVQLVRYLRPERTFADIDALVRQMDQDSRDARAALAASA